MKRCLLMWSVTALVLIRGAAGLAGGDPGTGIQNSPHDLRSVTVPGWPAIEAERVCFYCHTPHTANASARVAVSFQTYSNVPVAPGQPGSVSRICLGCHDGSIAVSIYGYVPPGAIANSSRGRSTAGIELAGTRLDLAEHHPIGFDYDVVVSKDSEIRPATSELRGANPSRMTIEDLLWSGRMECTTCHDVHNTRNEGRKLIWVEDGQSNFCFTCHNK